MRTYGMTPKQLHGSATLKCLTKECCLSFFVTKPDSVNLESSTLQMLKPLWNIPEFKGREDC